MAADKDELKDNRRHIGLRRISGSFKGGGDEMTLGSDVGSNPFPFTEEEKNSLQKVQSEDLSRNIP
jgi:hypothetical protein